MFGLLLNNKIGADISKHCNRDKYFCSFNVDISCFGSLYYIFIHWAFCPVYVYKVINVPAGGGGHGHHGRSLPLSTIPPEILESAHLPKVVSPHSDTGPYSAYKSYVYNDSVNMESDYVSWYFIPSRANLNCANFKFKFNFQFLNVLIIFEAYARLLTTLKTFRSAIHL